MSISVKQRICQVSWGWFATSMSTGGIALLLNQTPHQFPGLTVIGKIVFILNLVVFLSLCTAMGIRFVDSPSTLKMSFQDASETHFVATSVLSIATIIMGIESYGSASCGPWLQVAERVLFWLYVALAMLIGGTTLQGFGFIMSVLVYAEFLYRSNKTGLPKPLERPEMFIAVGPWSFTAVALIGMAEVAKDKWPQRYILSATDSSSGSAPSTVAAADIALVLATMSAVSLWMMSFFFFCIAAISTLAACRVFGGNGEMTMSMSWWSMIFPNTGFTLATIDIGEALESEGVLWVTSGMTIAQVAMWLMVAGLTIFGGGGGGIHGSSSGLNRKKRQPKGVNAHTVYSGHMFLYISVHIPYMHAPGTYTPISRFGLHAHSLPVRVSFITHSCPPGIHSQAQPSGIQTIFLDCLGLTD